MLEGNGYVNEQTVKKDNCGNHREEIVREDESIAAIHEDDEAQTRSMKSLEKDVLKDTNKDVM